MSLFFGGGQKVKPQFTGLAVQTSTSAIAIGLWYGKNRGAGNIIWQGDFKSHKQKQGGKGGGGKGGTTYTYSGSYQVGLCWGEIHGITTIWKDNSKKSFVTPSSTPSVWEAIFSLKSSGSQFSLFKGTNPQEPWGYMTTKHPTQALGYPDIAYLATANYDLGQSNAFPQHSFEVEALLWNTGVGGTVEDADPALVIEDFLANEVHGVGFNTGILSNVLSTPDATTTGDGTFQTYCRAMGFAMSPFLSSQQQAGEVIQRWADLCNTAIAWTGYSLKFHPYGSDEVTANGVTYVPDFPIRYVLTDDDYVYKPGEDPITFNRTDPADAYNSFSIIISNRDNEYNDLPVPWKDQGLIDQFGLKNEDSLDAKEITDPDMASLMVTYMGQRKAYVRNTFEFTLPMSFCRLEPMDVLQCFDPRFGTFLVLTREVSETDEGDFEIVAEEYSASISGTSSGGGGTQPVNNNPINTLVPPGPVNPPIIFEPPSSLSGGPQVWIVASGGDGTTYNPNWGGYNVWLSTDNSTFNQVGDMDLAGRQGKLTASLATYGGTNPDTTHTLKVDLLMSNGELEDAASGYDAQSGVTVSYVGNSSGYELLSYEDAELTGTSAYDLDSLWRGQYGTTIGAHSSGDDFARLDEAVFKYDLPEAYVGQTLYIKLQSFNIFGDAVEDISTVTTYSYTPTGIGFGTGTGGVPTLPTGLSGTAGSVWSKLTWNQNPVNDNVTGYQVWRATGASQPFGSATLIGTTTAAASEYTDSAVTGGQAYTYFLVAVNAVGSSANTSGINLTPTAVSVTNPFGFAFTKIPTVSKPLAVFDTPIAWTIPASLTDSQGTIVDSDTSTATAPSSNTDFDIQSPAGTSIGTMRFAAASLTATFIKASSSSIPLGQPVYIIAPSNLNGLSGAITGAIKGTR